MATLDVLPGHDIIVAMRGVLDYACWRGVFYVRSWPRPPRGPRSAAVQAAGAAFAAFSRALKLMDATLRNAAITATNGTTWTWKDLVSAAAYAHLNYEA